MTLALRTVTSIVCKLRDANFFSEGKSCEAGSEFESRARSPEKKIPSCPSFDGPIIHYCTGLRQFRLLEGPCHRQSTTADTLVMREPIRVLIGERQMLVCLTLSIFFFLLCCVVCSSKFINSRSRREEENGSSTCCVQAPDMRWSVSRFSTRATTRVPNEALSQPASSQFRSATLFRLQTRTHPAAPGSLNFSLFFSRW